MAFSNSNHNNNKQIKEFELSEEFQEKYGFTRIYTNDKNLVLETYRGKLISSKYFDDTEKTIDALKEEFMTNANLEIEFTDDLMEPFLKDFGKLLFWKPVQEASGVDSNLNPIQYCTNVITKEARLEDRLTKQIIYVMLSAYTNNPLNLGINSPSGEGKNWVIKKVCEKLPEKDVIRFSGMTAKAIFHSHGINVVKNEDTGEYEQLDFKLAEIDSQIFEKEQEIERTKDNSIKLALKDVISEYEHDKKELRTKSKKLIDLSHKILIFLDTPPPELLYAIMTLLSHDEYQTEYDYVDTHNGIKTKTNVLRGWPAVIFAQASDMGNYRRYTEIQRRFIVTNPRMDESRYQSANDLTVDLFGMPDFMYQAMILGQKEVDKCKELFSGIKSSVLEMSSKTRPNKNQPVYVPFRDAIKDSLPHTKAFDMTTGNRLMGFISLLTQINIAKRPRLVTFNPTESEDISSEITPIALFEDLQEAISVLENTSGLRPYQLEWYERVFLAEYRSKDVEDSRL